MSTYDKYQWLHEQLHIKKRRAEDVAKELGSKSANAIRARYSQLKKEYGELPVVEQENWEDNLEKKITLDVNKGGEELKSKRIIEINSTDLKNPKILMEKHGFDPDEWELVRARNEYWQGIKSWRQNNDTVTLYLSEIVVKPKSKVSLTFDDIDEYFLQLDPKKIPSIRPQSYDPDGYVLEICLADMQIGSLNGGVWGDRVENTVADIKRRAEKLKIQKIMFVLLGDSLHMDTHQRTTTAGTKLEVDMTPREAYDKTLDIIIMSVSNLLEIAPVEVLILPGNHDELSSYHLTKAIEYYFKECEDVEVDTTHEPRSWRRWGHVLVGWTHGDMAKTRIGKWLHQEARKDYGKSLFAEVHAGHIHHQYTIEDNGVIVRYLPTMVDNDEWHIKQGYVGAVRGTTSFLWHPHKGLREMWFTLA